MASNSSKVILLLLESIIACLTTLSLFLIFTSLVTSALSLSNSETGAVVGFKAVSSASYLALRISNSSFSDLAITSSFSPALFI